MLWGRESAFARSARQLAESLPIFGSPSVNPAAARAQQHQDESQTGQWLNDTQLTGGDVWLPRQREQLTRLGQLIRSQLSIDRSKLHSTLSRYKKPPTITRVGAKSASRNCGGAVVGELWTGRRIEPRDAAVVCGCLLDIQLAAALGGASPDDEVREEVWPTAAIIAPHLLLLANKSKATSSGHVAAKNARGSKTDSPALSTDPVLVLAWLLACDSFDIKQAAYSLAERWLVPLAANDSMLHLSWADIRAAVRFDLCGDDPRAVACAMRFITATSAAQGSPARMFLNDEMLGKGEQVARSIIFQQLAAMRKFLDDPSTDDIEKLLPPGALLPDPFALDASLRCFEAICRLHRHTQCSGDLVHCLLHLLPVLSEHRSRVFPDVATISVFARVLAATVRCLIVCVELLNSCLDCCCESSGKPHPSSSFISWTVTEVLADIVDISTLSVENLLVDPLRARLVAVFFSLSPTVEFLWSSQRLRSAVDGVIQLGTETLRNLLPEISNRSRAASLILLRQSLIMLLGCKCSDPENDSWVRSRIVQIHVEAVQILLQCNTYSVLLVSQALELALLICTASISNQSFSGRRLDDLCIACAQCVLSVDDPWIHRRALLVLEAMGALGARPRAIVQMTLSRLSGELSFSSAGGTEFIGDDLPHNRSSVSLAADLPERALGSNHFATDERETFARWFIRELTDYSNEAEIRSGETSWNSAKLEQDSAPVLFFGEAGGPWSVLAAGVSNPSLSSPLRHAIPPEQVSGSWEASSGSASNDPWARINSASVNMPATQINGKWEMTSASASNDPWGLPLSNPASPNLPTDRQPTAQEGNTKLHQLTTTNITSMSTEFCEPLPESSEGQSVYISSAVTLRPTLGKLKHFAQAEERLAMVVASQSKLDSLNYMSEHAPAGPLTVASLPLDILVSIFSFLGPHEVLIVRYVSTWWAAAGMDARLWLGNMGKLLGYASHEQMVDHFKSQRTTIRLPGAVVSQLHSAGWAGVNWFDLFRATYSWGWSSQPEFSSHLRPQLGGIRIITPKHRAWFTVLGGPGIYVPRRDGPVIEPWLAVPRPWTFAEITVDLIPDELSTGAAIEFGCLGLPFLVAARELATTAVGSGLHLLKSKFARGAAPFSHRSLPLGCSYFSYSSHGEVKSNNGRLSNTPKLRTGDRVGWLLNFRDASITFFRNGMSVASFNGIDMTAQHAWSGSSPSHWEPLLYFPVASLAAGGVACTRTLTADIPKSKYDW